MLPMPKKASGLSAKIYFECSFPLPQLRSFPISVSISLSHCVMFRHDKDRGQYQIIFGLYQIIKIGDLSAVIAPQCPNLYLFVCLSVCLFLYVSIFLPVIIFLSQYVYMSLYLSIRLCLLFSEKKSPNLYLCVCPSIYLSFSLFIRLCQIF